MIDVSVFGLSPKGHHLVSIALHGANAILIFVLIRSLAGLTLPAVIAAALWAIHPLRVESVAWIAERKDVLCAFFFLLALIAYVHYARRRSVPCFLATLAFFASALLSKPMAVTLPFVVLLLDYWPLGRLGAGFRNLSSGRSVSRGYRVLYEKTPFVVLTAISAIVTLHAQRQTGAMLSFEQFPVSARLANAVLAYAGYLGKTLLPMDLVIPYRMRELGELGPMTIAGAVALLIALTAIALVGYRKAPQYLVGWLWFAGMLVPVSGMSQVGIQSMADRYTYLPTIGLLLALAYGAGALHRPLRRLAGTASLLAMLLLIPVTRIQIGHWRNTVALYEHTLEVDPGNYFAHYALGAIYGLAKDPVRSEREYLASSRLHPNRPEPYYKLGILYLGIGKREMAMRQYRVLAGMRSPLADSLAQFISVYDRTPRRTPRPPGR